MKVYVVEMLRHNDRELHPYVIGVANTNAEAKQMGTIEEYWRGGKYTKCITPIEVGHILPEKKTWYGECVVNQGDL